VLKEQVLESVERRHADERAYQEALIEWQLATANPEQHPHWRQFYANSLRDSLRKANNRRKETLSQMTQDAWCVAVTREMQADLWYEQPNQAESHADYQFMNANALIANRNGNSPKVSVAAG
jgi:hypothetical protein